MVLMLESLVLHRKRNIAYYLPYGPALCFTLECVGLGTPCSTAARLQGKCIILPKLRHRHEQVSGTLPAEQQ
jgi:hypothetical protein